MLVFPTHFSYSLGCSLVLDLRPDLISTGSRHVQVAVKNDGFCTKTGLPFFTFCLSASTLDLQEDMKNNGFGEKTAFVVCRLSARLSVNSGPPAPFRMRIYTVLAVLANSSRWVWTSVALAHRTPRVSLPKLKKTCFCYTSRLFARRCSPDLPPRTSMLVPFGAPRCLPRLDPSPLSYQICRF